MPGALPGGCTGQRSPILLRGGRGGASGGLVGLVHRRDPIRKSLDVTALLPARAATRSGRRDRPPSTPGSSPPSGRPSRLRESVESERLSPSTNMRPPTGTSRSNSSSLGATPSADRARRSRRRRLDAPVIAAAADGVARDHALDPVAPGRGPAVGGAEVARTVEHHDLTALGGPPLRAIHEDHVADLERRLHRGGRDAERLGDELPHSERGQQHRDHADGGGHHQVGRRRAGAISGSIPETSDLAVIS